MAFRLPPGLLLLDHHCHSVTAADLSDDAFGSLLTESDRPQPPGTSAWDSALGLAVRRWCPPALGLEPHAPAADYLARRRELGPQRATGALLRAAALDACLVDTGLTEAAGAPLLDLPALARAGGARVREVVRLEQVAERLHSSSDGGSDGGPDGGPAGGSGTTAARFGADVAEALAATVRERDAIAVKSVAAYRHGLELDPARPSAAETARAAGEWLAAPAARLDHPVLLRHLLWTAVDLGLPIQLHTGFGDPDLTLHRADPSLLTPFVRAVEPSGVPLVLLHGHPYHRQAAWLAQAFPHVHCDLGLTLSYTGPGAVRVLGEFLELAPFGKVLFSTDAFGLPELFLTGAAAFRHALGALLADWIREGACGPADAHRLAAMLASGNARRLYGL
ncbi:amidohydrolase family protein [Streptacidiphilus sp. PB12-B1b]|uniref:amidohydrolase family protein n=1 Tax=Streptacidiphilus sp. PB12-B1b TaxID=2705012 RepID=UPI0015F8AA62|nr:amidohydrolase family protein [Streptacidiphilus sp. PB12-B1b]QMU78546.1 amidohydrolase family protein [Streptacidiphilus sp. PB12-B1b]